MPRSITSPERTALIGLELRHRVGGAAEVLDGVGVAGIDPHRVDVDVDDQL